MLDCHIADLIDEPASQDIPLIGSALPDGHVHAGSNPGVETRPAAQDPVAIRISEGAGGYRAGDIVICNQSMAPDLSSCLGRDCVARTSAGETVFGRLALGRREGSFTLAPPKAGAAIRYDLTLDWAAAAISLLRTLP